ncbi:MAG: hypothetical protein WBB58_01325 [Microgenomates group bacterium]
MSGERYFSNRSLTRHLSPAELPDMRIQATREKWSAPSKGRRAGWGIHGSSISEYGRTFQSVNNSARLRVFLHERAKKKGYTSIIDLMATESVVGEAASLGYDKGVAVSLGFPHDPKWDQKLGPGVIHTINGNIASVECWTQIRGKQVEIASTGFDVVISRPEGGLNPDYIPSDPILYYLMLQNMWQITALGGVMLFQVPYRLAEVSHEYFKQLIGSGIDVKLPPLSNKPNTSNPFRVRGFFGFPVRIEKAINAPTRLPRPESEQKIRPDLRPYLNLVGIGKVPRSDLL